MAPAFNTSTMLKRHLGSVLYGGGRGVYGYTWREYRKGGERGKKHTEPEKRNSLKQSRVW